MVNYVLFYDQKCIVGASFQSFPSSSLLSITSSFSYTYTKKTPEKALFFGCKSTNLFDRV